MMKTNLPSDVILKRLKNIHSSPKLEPKGSFALFKDGVQISKTHSTLCAALTEAYEAKVMIYSGQDFPSDPAPGINLANGYEIKLTN